MFDQRLVAQAVGRHTELAHRDAELLQHIVEAPQVLLQVPAGIAHVGVQAHRHALCELHGGEARRRIQRHEAQAPALAAFLDPRIPIRNTPLRWQAGGGEGHDIAMRAEHHGLLASQPHRADQPQGATDVAVIRAHLVDQRFDVNTLRRPTLVALRQPGAPVLLQFEPVVLGLPHEAVLAHPHRQPAQEAEVSLDRAGCQLVALPHPDHRRDVLVPQVAWVRQGLESGLCLQAMEEAAQELRALLARLVRDGFLQRSVQRVEQLQQNLQHLQWWRAADAVARKDVLGAQACPVLAANRLEMRRAARRNGALGAPTVSLTKMNVGHGMCSMVGCPLSRTAGRC